MDLALPAATLEGLRRRRPKNKRSETSITSLSISIVLASRISNSASQASICITVESYELVHLFRKGQSVSHWHLIHKFLQRCCAIGTLSTCVGVGCGFLQMLPMRGIARQLAYTLLQCGFVGNTEVAPVICSSINLAATVRRRMDHSNGVNGQGKDSR